MYKEQLLLSNTIESEALAEKIALEECSYTDGKTYLLLLSEDKEAAGFLSISKEDSSAYIEALFVEEAKRGNKVASKALLALENRPK